MYEEALDDLSASDQNQQSAEERKADYASIAEGALKRTKELLADERWALRRESPNGVVMSEREIDRSPIKCIKVMGFLPGLKAEDMAQAIWNFGEVERRKMEPILHSFEVIETIEGIGAKAKVYYQVNALPWPMSYRDGVALWTQFVEDGTCYFVATSVTHPSKPENPCHVRITLTLSVIVLEPTDNGVEVACLVHVNPNGNVPSSLVNSRNARLYDNIKLIAELSVGYTGEVLRSKKNIKESQHNP